jgi:hypothetical protein
LDASGDTGLTSNEAISFERHDHLVDRGRADLKVALHIGFGGWSYGDSALNFVGESVGGSAVTGDLR